MNRILLAFAIAWWAGLGVANAQAPEPAPAPAAAPAATSALPITDADLKGVSGPKAEDRAKGDPAGTMTGTVNDIPVSDVKKGLTLDDLVNAVGQNIVASNFIWCTASACWLTG
jgi:Amt family ammonium transporter